MIEYVWTLLFACVTPGSSYLTATTASTFCVSFRALKMLGEICCGGVMHCEVWCVVWVNVVWCGGVVECGDTYKSDVA